MIKKSPNPNVRIHIVVSGIVQGVFFRSNTKSTADRLGVLGWVRNKHDGTVEIMAEGEKGDMERFIQWCRQGPPGSAVKDVKMDQDEYRGEFQSFDIQYY